jgi:transketolase
MRDIRDEFFDVIGDWAFQDESVYIVTNDMDVFGLHTFRKNAGERFINAGVAEQNTVNIAAGLARTGKRVLIFGIASFLVFRAYEQLRVNIGSMRLPVAVVGIGQGFSFPYDGPSHHALHDIQLVRTIPEFEIVNVAEGATAKFAAEKVKRAERPLYIRLDKGPAPVLHSETDLRDGFSVLHDGESLCVVATGQILLSLKTLMEDHPRETSEIGLVDVFRIEPFPPRLQRYLSKYRTVLVVEENSSIGGLFSLLRETSEYRGPRIERLGDGLHLNSSSDYGSRSWHLEKHGLDKASLLRELSSLSRRDSS